MTKTIPAEPELNPSTKATEGSAERQLDKKRLCRKYDVDYSEWKKECREFDENWAKAYGIIFDQYCSTDMKRMMKEQPHFETTIRDDPLELLGEVEKQMHFPLRATYPMLALIETIRSLLAIRQGEKESLTNHLERYKSERNVMLTLFREGILDVYVERSQK